MNLHLRARRDLEIIQNIGGELMVKTSENGPVHLKRLCTRRAVCNRMEE